MSVPPPWPPAAVDPALDLSVIIPAYNAAATLGDQLDALVNQSYSGRWEIIVVNDGSHDNTAAIVEKWTARFPRVRGVNSDGRTGPAHARNIGARGALGASLAFCDADDIVGAEWVEAMATGLADHEFVCGPIELGRLNPAWLAGSKGTAGTQGAVIFDDVFPFASSCNLGIRRERFFALGGFDEGLAVGEDIELSLRLHLAAVTLHYLPNAEIHYRYRQTLRGLFDQARTYGASRPEIAERLRARTGHQASRWHGARNWLWLVRHVGLLRTASGRARWWWSAGLRIGAITGSWRVRRLYF